MTLGLIFWILMLIWAVFTAWSYLPNPATPSPHIVVWGSSALLFVLFLVLGWAIFGAPVRG
jgi:hypothetical protein